MGDPEYQEFYGMEMVRTPITNIHGRKNASVSSIEEMQDLVIATNTMPRVEWVKARTLCYVVAFTYFNKLLQVPIMILNEIYDIPYRDTFEALMEKPKQTNNLPVFGEILDFFCSFSKDMQDGTQEEFFHSPECLDILWPPDEYALIKLCRENKLVEFYKEAEQILTQLVEPDKPIGPLLEAVKLNQSLIKLPFQTTDVEIILSYNIWETYQAARLEQKIKLKQEGCQYIIDRTTERWTTWEEWYEKMVWWCNRRGAYLYGNKNPHTEIAGHH